MSEVEGTLLVLRGAAALLGAAFLFFAGRAYLRTRAPEMLALTLAVILFSVGAIAEGFALRGLGLSIDQAHVVESIVWLAAFAVLLGSLWIPQRN